MIPNPELTRLFATINPDVAGAVHQVFSSLRVANVAPSTLAERVAGMEDTPASTARRIISEELTGGAS